MNVIETSLPDVKIIEPDCYDDERGVFFESWHTHKFAQQVLEVEFKQDNVSYSRKGVLRGLHFQNPHGQGKLIQVLVGEVFDVAVDIRKTSSTFGQWVGVRLSEKNHRQLWVPQGFAHGFYVLSERAVCSYKCTEVYHPESEICIRWDDKDLAIEWPLTGEPIVSEKDENGFFCNALNSKS